jgi:hypothetical protein
MEKIYRKRKGVISEVRSKEINHYNPKKINIGDNLHENFYDRDGTLKLTLYITKQVLHLRR